MRTLLRWTSAFAGVVLFSSNPVSGFDLIGVSYFNGPVSRIDPVTGTGVALGTPRFGALNSLAVNSGGVLYSAAGSRLVTINPATGAGTAVGTLDFGTNTAQVRGLAFSPAGVLYAINNGGDDLSNPNALDNLYTIDLQSGLATFVGNTGVPGLQGLEFSSSGTLYGWEVATTGSGRGLVTIDPLNGAVMDVNPAIGGRAADIQTLAFGPDGQLYGAKEALYTVNTQTGTITLVGSGGYSDIRGLAAVPELAPALLMLLGVATAGLCRFRRRPNRNLPRSVKKQIPATKRVNRFCEIFKVRSRVSRFL